MFFPCASSLNPWCWSASGCTPCSSSLSAFTSWSFQSQSLKYPQATFLTLFTLFSKSKSNCILGISIWVSNKFLCWSSYYKPLIHRPLTLTDGILILPLLDSVTPLLKTSNPSGEWLRNLPSVIPLTSDRGETASQAAWWEPSSRYLDTCTCAVGYMTLCLVWVPVK